MRRTANTLATSVVGAFAVLALLLAPVAPASAYWPGAGAGSGTSTTGALQPPTAVTVPPTSAENVDVSWTPSSGSLVPTGYFVSRISAAETVDACGTDSATLTTDVSCIDSVPASGTYTYRVTAVFRTWTAASASSPTVIVTAPPPPRVGSPSLVGAAS